MIKNIGEILSSLEDGKINQEEAKKKLYYLFCSSEITVTEDNIMLSIKDIQELFNLILDTHISENIIKGELKIMKLL